MKLDARTKRNLKKVFVELPLLAEKHPKIKEDFDMDVFGVYMWKTKDEIRNNHCGTIGCLAGNCARLFKPKKGYFFSSDGKFSYSFFLRMEFPSLYSPYGEANITWDFLFSSKWRCFAPTFDQAMERLKMLIDNDFDVTKTMYDYSKNNTRYPPFIETGIERYETRN